MGLSSSGEEIRQLQLLTRFRQSLLKLIFLIKTGQTLNCYSSLVTTEEIVSEPVELIIVVVAPVFVLSVKATNLC